MSLTPYIVAAIKCDYDGPPEGDFAPINCFTPPGPGYILAANLDAGTYEEIYNCDICVFRVTSGLYIINIWNGQEWRIDYVEAPTNGYIITGSKTDGSIFTLSSEVATATPIVNIWQAITFFFISYTVGQLIKTIMPQPDILRELTILIITYFIVNSIGVKNIWQAFVIMLIIYLITSIIIER